MSAGRVEESDLELSVITSQNSHYGGSDRSMGQIRGNISLQKIFHNKSMMKIFGWRRKLEVGGGRCSQEKYCWLSSNMRQEVMMTDGDRKYDRN